MKKFLQSIIWIALAFGCSLASAQVVQRDITAINNAPTAACSSGSCVVFDMQGKGAAAIQVVGTYTAAGGLSAQVTADGATWKTLGASTTFKRLSTGVSTATITSGEQDVYQLSSDCTGALACRITALGAVTGTASISVVTSIASIGGGGGSSGGGGTDGVTQGSTTSGQSGPLMQGAVTTAAPSYTTAQTSPLSLTTGGGLRIAAPSGAFASGAFASGAFASGSMASGAMVDLGAQADAAAAGDTSTASLIALFKRSLQHLTTLESANTQLPSSATVATATLTNVAASVTSVTCLPSNAVRLRPVIYNDSASATLYVKAGATASATSFTWLVPPGGTLTLDNLPVYTGILDCIWSAAVGFARVTEF